MTSALGDWLTLREPYDHAARSGALVDALFPLLPRDRAVQVLDLGTGTGSNLRYLAPRLTARQRWTLVDQDPALLAQIPSRMTSWANISGTELSATSRGLLLHSERLICDIETRCLDLGTIERDTTDVQVPTDDKRLFTGHDLVTGSALLDLVSATWLRALASHCRASGANVLFALTYNGRSRCSPGEPEDDTILELFNQHQPASDKGFGAAAGPDAVDYAARCFADVGYRVRREPSHWVLPPAAGGLQRRLIQGWADAVSEIAPERDMIDGWLARRLSHVATGRSTIIVEHEDLAAW